MNLEISKLDVESRYQKIKDYIIKTPMIYATKLSELSGNKVYVKLENLQRSGSFKLRGALSKLIVTDPIVLKRGIVAASAGNHSQGVSFAAKLLDIPATIVMPKTAPLAKINATRNYGVDVILHGDFFDDANDKAIEIVKATNKTLIHAFNDLDIILGQASIGIEIIEQVKDADYVLVPVGGGGILAGIASYIKQVNPRCKLIGVESENVPSYYQARKAKKILSIDAKLSIADGIAVKQSGDITFEILNKYVDDVILVSESEIAKTILFLFENCKIVAEGAGAVASAAILFNKLKNVKGKKIVCVLSGGNIDVTTFLNITNRALIDLRRRIILKIDAPLGKEHLKKITNVIDLNGVKIFKISDSQLENTLAVNHEIIRLVIDINAKEELKNIVNDLEGLGYVVMEKDFINSVIN
ncbi:MAG: threonine ammonia-lyase [Spiroplasma sp.]|nr:threonine ammonia-lyase [Spiroplasma sp.]